MSETAPRALVVEDDRAWQEILTEILCDRGLAVDVADSLEAAVSALRTMAHRVAVVDLSLNAADYHNQDGLRVLEAVRRHDPGCAAVLLTGFATVELAVSALSEYGAFTCLRKETFRRAEFRAMLDQALAVAPRAEPVAAGAAGGHGPAVGPMASEPAAASGAATALLVEDDAGWQNVLAELLAEQGFRVDACPSYGEALGYLRRGRYDVAVVDLSLASSVAPSANQDGYPVLAGTQAAGIPTVVVSGSAAPASIELAYSAYGIFAYLEKQAFGRDGFRSAIAQAARHVGSEDPLAMLTPRERDVMELLVQGLTNKGIANSLVISTNTVKRYLKTIFEKLDVDSRAAAVARAVGAGMGSGARR